MIITFSDIAAFPIPMATIDNPAQVGWGLLYRPELSALPAGAGIQKAFAYRVLWRFMLYWCRASLARKDVIYGDLELCGLSPRFYCALPSLRPGSLAKAVFRHIKGGSFMAYATCTQGPDESQNQVAFSNQAAVYLLQRRGRFGRTAVLSAPWLCREQYGSPVHDVRDAAFLLCWRCTKSMVSRWEDRWAISSASQ